MDDSKLIRLLKKIEKPVLKRFKIYIHSDYFITYQALRTFSGYILDSIDKDAPATKKEAFIHVFGQKKFHEQKVNDLMSYMVTALQDFIGIDSILRDENVKSEHLLEKLIDLNEKKEFSRVGDNYLKRISSAPRDENYYSRAFNYYGMEQKSDAASHHHRLHNSLLKKIEAFDLYCYLVKLKTACEIINLQNITGGSTEISMIDTIVNEIEKRRNDLSDEPLIIAYFLVYKTLTEPAEEHYYSELIQNLFHHTFSYTRHDATELYAYAQNYCVKKINQGRLEYLRKLFEIYQAALPEKLLFEGDHLSPFMYKNIASVGLRLKEFDWVENFISDWRKYIPGKERENVWRYCTALLHYERKNYAPAIRELQKVEYTDQFINLDARALLLKIYYERDETELLRAVIQAFRVYLHRTTQISDYQKESYLNLLKFTLRLDNTRQQAASNKFKCEKAKKIGESASRTPVVNLTWLNQMIEDFA